MQDGELWKLWYTFIPSPEQMKADIEKRLEQQTQRNDAAVRGHRLGHRQGGRHDDLYEHRRRSRAAWKSAARGIASKSSAPSINTECKLMLLTHAFENLNCIAVEFRTHFFNQQSRRAIERLGAKLDGVLRNHRRSSDGTLRDTCVYSIIASEWPTVRSHLRHQLAIRGAKSP